MLNLKHIIKSLSLSLISISLITVSSLTLASDSEAQSSLKTVSDTKKLKTYLKEDANLGAYKSITMDPVVATFKDGWLKRYNQDHKVLSHKIRDRDAVKIKARVEKQFQITFPDYLKQNASLELVNTPNRQTLRLKPVISDLVIHAPDVQGNASNVVMVRKIGSATLTLEIYDASSNVLLAKLVSEEETRDNHQMIRTNRVVNNSEFKRLYKDWAKDLIKLMK